jgi:hypothetical protein
MEEEEKVCWYIGKAIFHERCMAERAVPLDAKTVEH